MKYKFSQRSLDKLKQVHPLLVQTCHDCLETGIMDFTVIDGIRTREEQRRLVERGVSKTMNSKHLPQADGYSHAVDIVPWPIDWNDWLRFGRLIGLMQAVGLQNGIVLRSGIDWDMDGQNKDHRFLDAPHLEVHKIINEGDNR